MMNCCLLSSLLLLAVSSWTTTNGFVIPDKAKHVSVATQMVKQWDRSVRSAGVNDRTVELNRPLGIILKEDPTTKNVYVETVAPKGNAARTGLVKQGDIVTMCSATFGDQMWSTRGVGLTRVLAAIRVRSGPVKLCLANANENMRQTDMSSKRQKAAEEARRAAQEKKDRLLKELEQDEERLTKKRFFGLF